MRTSSAPSASSPPRSLPPALADSEDVDGPRMDDYFRTTYRAVCNRTSPELLTSPEFLRTACHLGSLLMFTTSFYALFLVLTVSPRAMRSSVPYILNLHLWTMFCDFMFAIMLLPYFMLPLLVIKPFGVLHDLGTPPKLQLWLAFASLGGMCSAIISLFEYRHRSIVSNSRFVMRNKPTILLYNLVLYGYHINFGVPEVLTMPDDQEAVKWKLLQTLPCPPPVFFEPDAFVVQEDGRRLFNPHMYFTCLTISLLAAFYALHTLWHLRPQNNPLMSQSTRKFQRNFLFSSAVQASIPVTVVLVPNVYWNLTITFGFHSQEANNISVVVLTLHGIAASLGIVFLYTPYRNFTKNLFRRHVLKTKRVSSISMSNLDSSVVIRRTTRSRT